MLFLLRMSSGLTRTWLSSLLFGFLSAYEVVVTMSLIIGLVVDLAISRFLFFVIVVSLFSCHKSS